MVVIIMSTSVRAGKGEILIHRTAAWERLKCGRWVHHSKRRKQPRCPTKGDRVNEMRSIHARDRYLATRVKHWVALPHQDIY